jgi:hypothetical protein
MMLKQTTVRGKNSSLNGVITEGQGRELLRTISPSCHLYKFLSGLLGPLSIRLSYRFRKPSLQPDLCAPEGLRNNAVRLGQFSLLKKLLLVDPWNQRFSIKVNRGNP